jgi:hypothetical protein
MQPSCCGAPTPIQSLARYGRLMEALSSGSTVEGQIQSEKESRARECGAEITFFSCGKQRTQVRTQRRLFYCCSLGATRQRSGRPVARGASAFPSRRPEFEPRSNHVGSVVTLGHVFSEYFGFPCQFSFRRLLHIHHHISSGTGTKGQLVADVPSGLSLTSPQETLKKKN